MECGEIVKAFLLNPLDKRYFDPFYFLCHRHMIRYLRFLRTQGWVIPVEKRERDNPLSDVAIDVLGPMLQSRANRPYFVVFDYYKRHGITNPESVEPREIYRHFTVLLRGFAKKELGRIPGDKDLQAGNLRRRFNDILRGREYGSFNDAYGKAEFIFRREHERSLRRDKPPFASDELGRVVVETFTVSRTRREWCQNIFEALDKLTDFQNYLPKHDLLTAVVSVNAEYIEIGWRPWASPSPGLSVAEREMEEAIERALRHVKTGAIRKFVENARIEKNEADMFLAATKHYLADLAHSGDPDPIPEYFRYVMPEDRHSLYLERYKYVFETIIDKAAVEFRRLLKTISTAEHVGDYSNMK